MRIKFLFLLVMSIFISGMVYALPPGFTMSTVVSGTNRAITIRFAPDGRMFYLEQWTGAVRTVSTTGTLNPVNWVNLSVDTGTGFSEEGLLGMAFDPNFTSNRYIYFYYTVPSSQDFRVVRVTEDTTTFTGNPLSIVTVLNIPDSTSATNHNGGNMAFGPDGNLYISVGDGGGSPANRAQEDTHFLGKILKLNVSGSLPVTYSNPTDLFYCKGVRNSFDLAWNPANNVLYASENGPSSDDEANRIVQGGNYGWPIYQGYTNVTGFNSALYNWSTIIAPTGITFYPASGNFPFDYDNNMFVVDYSDGRIYRMQLGTQSVSLDTVVNITTWDNHPTLTYADIEPGPDGALYIAAFSHILKVAYTTSVENWMLYEKDTIEP